MYVSNIKVLLLAAASELKIL